MRERQDLPTIRRTVTISPRQMKWLEMRARELADETSQASPNVSAVIRSAIDHEMKRVKRSSK